MHISNGSIMAFLSPHKNKAAELDLILARWENRYELRLLSKTVPRSLIVAAIVSLVFGVAGYLYFRLRAEQLAVLSAALFAGSFLLNLVKTAIFPRSPQERARYFDIEFGLQERISTAMELMSGRLRTHPEIESRQIADALVHARQINARDSIPLDFRPRELALMCLLFLAVFLVIALPLFTGQYPVVAAPSVTLEEPVEEVREIIETIAKDTDLGDIDRRELLDALEVALERLEEEDISEEEAFAAMSQLQAEIEKIENQLEDTIDLDQSALEAAAEALKDFFPASDNESVENEQGQPSSGLDDLSNALEEMAQQAGQMSSEETQALAEALQEAAAELAETNPELSQRLSEMAEALEEGASEDLQEYLEQAQQELSQEQQQQERSQNAQNMLQEQGERAQEAADGIGRQQAEQQEMTDPRQGQSELSESGQQQAGQESSQQSDSAQQRANQGEQQSDRNRPGSVENTSVSRDSRSAGAGAGEGEPSNLSLAGAAGEDQGADTDNRTRGTGEIQYEAIYSPSGISGGGADEIRLRSDAGDQTLNEGDFDDNPLGESRVSYDTVFSEYQNSANRALESDYVPLGLRDVVRDYFTSLDPNGYR
ncbi:MAG: hypothetical protein OXG60_16385 [Chloroflexi bacterium]|nr:hypothetical protein [Chloroflexota bacterium]